MEQTLTTGRKLGFSILLLLLNYQIIFAQSDSLNSFKVFGNVVDQNQQPVPYANVLIKGTTKGTLTDENGEFELLVPEGGIVVISFLGYASVDQKVNRDTPSFKIILLPDESELSEVVVTALGIKKEKRAIGYSVDQIPSEQLNSTGESNVLLNLSGKAPGVQVSGSSNGVDGSPRVIIRGVTSLSSDNQPLYVLDGLPLLSNRSLSESLFSPSGGGGDLGNPLSDINPNDIQNVTILKGASATALYGSRGANGVILIETKKGKEGQKGWGVSISTSATFQKPLILPEPQLEYGQGFNGEFNYVDGLGGGTNESETRLWGPKYEGQIISQWDPQTGGAIEKPWLPYGSNNLEDFFVTGHTFQENVSLTHVTESSNMRLSLGHQDIKGIVPNTGLSRITGSINSSFKMGDKLTLTFVGTGSTMSSENRDFFGGSGSFSQVLFLPTNIDINDLRNYKDEFGNKRSFYRNGPNPYWDLYENLDPVERNRFSTSIGLTYAISNELSIQGNLYQDTNLSDSRTIRAKDIFNLGSYSESFIKNNEVNADARINFNKEINADLNLSAMVGVAIRNEQSMTKYASSVGGLVVRDIYNLGNSAKQPVVSNNRTEKEVQSVFGSAELNYKSIAFLTITGRNDWSSTLPRDEWSFFYPSFSGSFIFTDAFNMNSSLLSFGKLRGSWAQVGNDTQPYALNRYINRNTNSYNGQPVLGLQNVIPATSLIPEQSTSFEVGGELYFAKNKIRLDVAYYNNKSDNQLVQVENAWERGARYAFINAGTIVNKGVEFKLDIKTLDRPNLTWDINLNFSRNRGSVSGFPEDLVNFKIIGAWNGNEIRATNGEPYAHLVGFEYFLDSQDSYDRLDRQKADYLAYGYTPAENIYGTGEILTRNGLPMTNTFRGAGSNLGIIAPLDWTAGISNTFRYKNVQLNFLFDIRKGGHVISTTSQLMSRYGLLERSVGTNEHGVDKRASLEDGGGIIVKGIDIDTGLPNALPIRAQDLYSPYILPTSDFTRDATNIKLKEVSLGYSFNRKVLENIGVTGLRISAVARNILILKNNLDGIDSETANLGNLNNGSGFEYGSLPNTRSLGFTLSVDF
ncbi:SusC/RagA family TonB-linked outer membrane protein [Algoriphagus aquimarinus]|uniref:SusC/RagA family TonB-linked outer membrane protein n=1 Tax=Algoriphagus aquimarinus TaxID=237018 RepID=UPI0030DA13BA|tara:strand:+ start:6635 stop:9895 length:3261 start_codon:yes stop_codon:yes gene_type:complete